MGTDTSSSLPNKTTPKKTVSALSASVRSSTLAWGSTSNPTAETSRQELQVEESTEALLVEPSLGAFSFESFNEETSEVLSMRSFSSVQSLPSSAEPLVQSLSSYSTKEVTSNKKAND